MDFVASELPQFKIKDYDSDFIFLPFLKVKILSSGIKCRITLPSGVLCQRNLSVMHEGGIRFRPKSKQNLGRHWVAVRFGHY